MLRDYPLLSVDEASDFGMKVTFYLVTLLLPQEDCRLRKALLMQCDLLLSDLQEFMVQRIDVREELPILLRFNQAFQFRCRLGIMGLPGGERLQEALFPGK